MPERCMKSLQQKQQHKILVQIQPVGPNFSCSDTKSPAAASVLPKGTFLIHVSGPVFYFLFFLLFIILVKWRHIHS